MNRWCALVPSLWLGFLLCVATLATPPLFVMLVPAEAGKLAARMLAQEAYTSLALGAAMLGMERLRAKRWASEGRGSQFSTEMVLALGTIACTIVGYFVVQSMMAAAKAGQGPTSFATLHIVSVGFFVLKAGLVAALAWRATSRLSQSASS